MARNYYTVLGLPQNATNRQIRQRFLEIARERHPDRFQGEEKVKAEEHFQDVTQAFNVLLDADRRRELDAELARPRSGSSDGFSEAAKVYIQRGVKEYRERGYGAAADNFHRATQEDPDNAKAWYHLAMAGQHVPRWRTRARAAADKACELDPMNVSYLKIAGKLNADGGMHVQAAKYYRSALDWGGEDEELQRAFEASLGQAKNEP